MTSGRAAPRLHRDTPRMDGKELWGVGARMLAERTGVSLATARRWKRARRIPAAIARFIQVAIFGELGVISRAWRGWSLRDGALVSPEGWTFSPGEILSLPFLRQQLAAYQAEQRVPRQADWLERRYERAGDRRLRSG